MKIKLNQIKELTTNDFINHLNDDYEFNNYHLKTIAEFYDVKNEDKKLLFQLEKKFKEITQSMIEKKINIQEYLLEIEKLNKLANKNIIIGMNNKNEFVVSLKANLDIRYQKNNQSQSEKKQSNPKKLLALYAIEWEESERGWGVRPDGYSFHRSNEEAEDFIKNYQNKLPIGIQDEYSRPRFEKAKLIEVSEGLYNYVIQYGSIWLSPKNESDYKTYNADYLYDIKKKKKLI